MKKFFIFFLALLTINAAIAQTCLPDGIHFITQSQIDNFQNNYPGCTQIDGIVTINGYEINNLNGLNVVTSIGGDLLIVFTDVLTNFMGLNNLTSVGGDFNITENAALTSLTGLNALTSIGGDFNITENAALTSLSGLNALTSIGGELIISSNEGLTNLSALNSLISIGGILEIQYNNSLTSISGLENIDAGSITDVYIDENSLLSGCQAQSICNYLAYPNGTVNIYNNAAGCNNPSEVANNCGIMLPCLPYGNYYFINQDDIDDFQINYPNCTEIEGDITIFGNDITNLNGLSTISSIGNRLTISYTDSLVNLTGLNSLFSVGSEITISFNNALTSLAGMDNLSSIGSTLAIYLNSALANLNGLHGLKSLGGSLMIEDDSSLYSISGLENLTSIGGYLYVTHNEVLTSLSGLDNIDASFMDALFIYGNPSLSACAVQSICDYLGSPNGTTQIYNNVTGCNSQQEVELACGVSVESLTQKPIVSIYPNPATENITIGSSTFGYITILNPIGQEPLKQKITEPITTININTLPSGLYIVKLVGEKGVQVGKIIKQ